MVAVEPGGTFAGAFRVVDDCLDALPLETPAFVVDFFVTLGMLFSLPSAEGFGACLAPELTIARIVVLAGRRDNERIPDKVWRV